MTLDEKIDNFQNYNLKKIVVNYLLNANSGKAFAEFKNAIYDLQHSLEEINNDVIALTGGTSALYRKSS